MEHRELTILEPFPREHVCRQIGEQHLILHTQRPRWMIVNDTGLDIIRKLDGTTSCGDIAEYLAQHYGVERRDTLADVFAFLEECRRAGFVPGRETPRAETGGFERLFLNITDRCNLRCAHCCFPHQAQTGELEDDRVYALVGAFYRAGGTGMIISGGEPLMRKELVLRLLRTYPDRPIGILTNGTGIDDTLADAVAGSNARLQISVDGPTAELHDSIRGPGAFDAAMQGFERLRRRGLSGRVDFGTTLMQFNMGQVEAMLDFATGCGIGTIRFLPLRREGRARENWARIQCPASDERWRDFHHYIYHEAISRYRDVQISSGLSGYVFSETGCDRQGRWCPFGRTLVVDPGGRAYLCPMFRMLEYGIGNVVSSSLKELYGMPRQQELTSWIHARPERIEQCGSCDWRGFCQSGCAGLALLGTGTVDAPDEFCEVRKSLYQNAFERLARGGSVPGVCVGGQCS